MLVLRRANYAFRNKNFINGLRSFSCFSVQQKYHQFTTPAAVHFAPLCNTRQRCLHTDPQPSIGLIGFWQSLSNSTPVAYVQDALVRIHDLTGLPWWASIVFSTFLIRTMITLPLTIYQHKIAARIEQISLEMPPIVEELKREAAMAKKKYNWTDKQTQLVYRRSIKKQWQKLIIRDNCHPFKTLIVLWGQIPLWVFQSVALRNLVFMLPDPLSLQAQIIATEMTLGGFSWIPNLIEVDQSYILPVALGLINLGIIEIQAITRTRPSTKLQKIATNLFRGLSVVMVPIACTVPSALCVYWVTSSTCGLAQNLLMLSPKLRRIVGIPKTNSELSNPYEHLWIILQIRARLIEPLAEVVDKSNAKKAGKHMK